MEYNIIPRRKKRSESFLGIHFDFHANEGDVGIGENVTREMIEKIIDEVQPDYMQCDCKGHVGWSSYPTKVGNAAAGIVKDTLQIWREVTREKGISLYMHYSGVWDTQALKQHPEWARIDEKGEIDKNNTSVFGPYVDQFMIPQLKELCDVYDVDGVWVDGDNWATCQDYGNIVIEAFKKATGLTVIPKNPEEKNFYEYTEFCRQGFRNYLKHYIDELHKHKPGFEIASNWAYTSFMPEPVSTEIDFISGDFSMQNSVNAARFEGRCMTKQEKPWDLMAWSFSEKWAEGAASTKSSTQLKQEAAVVLALGGGFQAYFFQKRDGSVNLWQMELMRETARFCRERQQYCHRAVAVPQIGIFYSTEDFYRKNKRAFGTWDGNITLIQGTLFGLLNNQYSTEVLMDHHVKQGIGDYPLLIIPEWEYIEEETKETILQYVHNGGNLIVISPNAVKGFKDELGITFSGEILNQQSRWIHYAGWMSGLKSDTVAVTLADGVREFGRLYNENDFNGSFTPAASINRYGKGLIAGVYVDLGKLFINSYTATMRNFLGGIVKELFDKPIVEVMGSHQVDVIINTIDGKLAVNLVNTSGPHADKNVYVYDDIPVIGPLTVKVLRENKPERVMLQPENIALEYSYKDGVVAFELPKLEIHSIILFE